MLILPVFHVHKSHCVFFLFWDEGLRVEIKVALKPVLESDVISLNVTGPLAFFQPLQMSAVIDISLVTHEEVLPAEHQSGAHVDICTKLGFMSSLERISLMNLFLGFQVGRDGLGQAEQQSFSYGLRKHVKLHLEVESRRQLYLAG